MNLLCVVHNSNYEVFEERETLTISLLFEMFYFGLICMCIENDWPKDMFATVWPHQANRMIKPMVMCFCFQFFTFFALKFGFHFCTSIFCDF